MSLILFIISLLNIGAEIYQHNIRNIAGFMLLVFLGIVMGGAYNIPDEDNYKMYYESSKYFTGDIDPFAALYFQYSMDLGYTLSNQIFFNWGFFYHDYKLIVTVFALSIIWMISKKLVGVAGIVLFFYYQYPFFLDVPQIRNFIVEVMLLVALTIYTRKKFVSKIEFLCVVLLAATFHKIALAYLIIVIVLILQNSSLGKNVLKFFLLLGMAMPFYASFIIGNLEDISFFIAGMDNFSQYAAYATQEMRFGFLIPYFHIMSLTGVIWFIRKNVQSKNHKEFINILYVSYLGMILLLPLMAIHGDFNRIPRNLLLPTYIALAMYLQQITDKYKKLKIFISFFLLMYIITYIEFYIIPELAVLPQSTMRHNFILESISDWLD